jgi:serine/threonine protein phosphatase PrpC
MVVSPSGKPSLMGGIKLSKHSRLVLIKTIVRWLENPSIPEDQKEKLLRGLTKQYPLLTPDQKAILRSCLQRLLTGGGQLRSLAADALHRFFREPLAAVVKMKLSARKILLPRFLIHGVDDDTLVSPDSQRWKVVAVTNKGHSDILNQDGAALYMDNDRKVILVADGMGKPPAGDVASGIALTRSLLALQKGQELSSELIETISGEIAELGTIKNFSEMGTTLAAVEIRETHGRLFSAGDVLVFHFRGDQLTLLNSPDWVTKHGMPIEPSSIGLQQQQPPFSQEDAEKIIRHHEDAYLRYALGYPLPQPFPVISFDVKNGDRLLVATDGFYGSFLSLEFMRRIVTNKEKSLDDIAQELKDEVLPRAGDHVTFALAEV